MSQQRVVWLVMGGAESTVGSVFNHLSTGALYTEEHCRGLCDAATAVQQCMANECEQGTQLAGDKSWKDACNDYQRRVSLVYADIPGPDMCNGWCDIGCTSVPEQEDCFPIAIPVIGPYFAQFYNKYKEAMGLPLRLLFCVAWAMLGCITSKSTLRQRCEGITKEDVQGQYCKRAMPRECIASLAGPTK